MALAPRSFPAQTAAEAPYRQVILAIQSRIEAGDLAGAQEAIVSARKQFPRDGGLDNLEGVIAVQRGNTALARTSFQSAIQHSPQLAASYLNLARLDLETAATPGSGHTDEALALFDHVLALDPGNAEANLGSAELLLSSGKAAAAAQRIAAASQTTQQTSRAEAIRCGAEAALGHAAQARSLAMLLAEDATLTEADIEAALPGLRAGRRADLLEDLLQSLARRHPLQARALGLLGLAQEAQGKLAAARATLEQAFTADPASVSTLSDLSRVAVAQGKPQEALGYLAHARALSPHDAALAFQFGAVCFDMNLLGEAQKSLGEALALRPDDPQYVLAMAKVTMLSQDPLKAAPFLEHYRRIEPSDANGLLLTGSMYFRAKDFGAAVPWLSRAASVPATEASADLYLGSICRQQHELAKGLAYLATSARQEPGVAQTHAEMGETLLQLKRFDEAEAELNRAIQLDPNNYAANFGLVQLYARNNDPRRSAQAAHFDEVKNRRDQEMQQAMRVIEVRRESGSLPSK